MRPAIRGPRSRTQRLYMVLIFTLLRLRAMLSFKLLTSILVYQSPLDSTMLRFVVRQWAIYKIRGYFCKACARI